MSLQYPQGALGSLNPSHSLGIASLNWNLGVLTWQSPSVVSGHLRGISASRSLQCDRLGEEGYRVGGQPTCVNQEILRPTCHIQLYPWLQLRDGYL